MGFLQGLMGRFSPAGKGPTPGALGSTRVITHPLLYRNLVILCILKSLYDHYATEVGKECRVANMAKTPTPDKLRSLAVDEQDWKRMILHDVSKMIPESVNPEAYLNAVISRLVAQNIIYRETEGQSDRCRIFLSCPLARIFVILDQNTHEHDRAATIIEAGKMAMPLAFLNIYNLSFPQTIHNYNLFYSGLHRLHPMVFERLVEALTYQLLFDQHQRAINPNNQGKNNFTSTAELIDNLVTILQQETLAGQQFDALTRADHPPLRTNFLSQHTHAVLTKLHATGHIVVDQVPDDEGKEKEICKLSPRVLAGLNEYHQPQPANERGAKPS